MSEAGAGAVAAHAAYNGSGTQGLAVTNKIHGDDGDVMSVFWNKNDTTRQLLFGSSIVEIPVSGSGGNLTTGGDQIFTVNNHIDALGDLYLQITTIGSTYMYIRAFQLLACIRRIEFMVGTQIWQTLNTDDIGALNMTEMSEDAYECFTLAMSGGFRANGTRNLITAYSGGGESAMISNQYTAFTGVLRLPMLSRRVGPKLSKFTDISQSAYLLAGAPHQTVKIRVYMAQTLPSNLSAITGFQLRLFGQSILMCNEEREQIRTMPMGLQKRLKMTQNVTQTFTANAAGVVPCTLDLDHFSLFASHIIIYIAPTTGAPVNNCSVQHAELKLNSSSFSGLLEGPLLTGPVADALGLYSNGLYNRGANMINNFFIFPLASHAYGGSSVPLNRFDNIRMYINVVIAGISSFTVSATCVGETTALYRGGAASLAMY